MDFSELLPILIAALTGLVSLAVLMRARKIEAKGRRWSLIGLTGLVSIAALLVAGALIYFDTTYTRHLTPLAAPDGKHLAITSYTINTGAGADEAEVAIRAPWSPYAHRVYKGPAQYEPNAVTPEPTVRWVDGTHLEIGFHTYVSADGTASQTVADQGCASFADRVTITCIENRVHAVR